MSASHAPASAPPRHSTYATKLFDDPRRRRRRRRPAGRVAPRRPAADSSGEPTMVLIALSIVIGAVIAIAAVPEEPEQLQRPDPAVYRQHVELVSVDRIGTMFYGVVSQGYFLLDAAERRRGLEGLVRHIRDEGFESLYLAEASGRTVARWQRGGLELRPDSDPGS